MAEGDIGELQILEREIAELKMALKSQREENRLLRLWRDHLIGDKGDGCESPDVRAAMREGLNYQKDTLERITGVNITETTTEILRQGERTKIMFDTEAQRWRREPVTSSDDAGEFSVVKRQVIEGSCGETEFQLQMNLEDTMDKEGNITCNIQQLSISASENIYTDFGDFMERMASERNAQGFLRLLDSYAKWRAARETTFQYFISKYPEIAESPSVKTLHLKHPVRKLTFIIDWDLIATDIYRIVPDIHLTVQVPKEVLRETDVAEVAPEKFKIMLKELGIERTLHTLVALLMKS